MGLFEYPIPNEETLNPLRPSNYLRHPWNVITPGFSVWHVGVRRVRIHDQGLTLALLGFGVQVGWLKSWLLAVILMHLKGLAISMKSRALLMNVSGLVGIGHGKSWIVHSPCMNWLNDRLQLKAHLHDIGEGLRERECGAYTISSLTCFRSCSSTYKQRSWLSWEHVQQSIACSKLVQSHQPARLGSKRVTLQVCRWTERSSLLSPRPIVGSLVRSNGEWSLKL